MKRLSLAAILLSATVILPVLAQSLTLGDCSRLREKIDSYDDLRRKGGSASQMASWKKSRAALQERFRNGDCRQHGPALW